MKIKTLGKKALALVISLAVLLSCVIISGITASAVTVWDGSTKLPVDSDSDGVCEIYTAEELAWVAQTDTSSQFILMNDIYVNDLKVEGETITKLDGSPVDTATLKTWVSNKTFSGTIDGNGHTISGLYNADAATNNSTDCRGLVGAAYRATFKNLRIANTYIKDGFFMGNLFGKATASGTTTIDTVYVEDTYVSTAATGNYPAVGGLFGYVQNGAISVSNVAVVDTYLNNTAAAGRAGAFWGDSWNCATATVTNSYSALTSHNPWGSGRGVAASNGSFNSVCSTSNIYAAKVADAGAAKLEATLVSQDFLKGQNALVSAYGLGESFYTTAGYPIQGIFLDTIDAGVNKQLGTAPFEGSGTEADPYLIKTADDLKNAIGTYGMGKYYKLANDIYLNDVDKIDWATGVADDGYDANVWFTSDHFRGEQYNGYAGQGVFTGTLDGDGYAVHGLYIPFSSVSSSSGLVPVTSNATIKNIAIKNSFMAGGHWTGGITGFSSADTTFDTILVDETVTVVGYDAGNKYFISTSVDKNDANKAVSPYAGTVSGGVHYESECTGGIVGYVSGTGTVSNCAVYGTVRAIEDGEIFATTNPLTNGGNPVNVSKGSHICAMVGTGWNSTVTITDCVSKIQLHDSIGGASTVFSCTDSYAQAKHESQTCCNVVEETKMTGKEALTNLTGLDTAVWTATSGYPVPKVFTCLNTTAHNGEHDWTDWAETTTPGCDTPGEETRECVVCGEDDSNPLNATGHSPKNEWTSDANNHWHACDNCDDHLDEAAHSYDQQVEKTEYSAGSADCTQPAKFYYSCVCGKAGTATFDSGSQLGHSPKTEWTSDDTKHWHECNNCDDYLDEAAHNFDQQVVNDTYKATNADCDDAATYYYSCVCGKAGTTTFASGEPNGHSPKTEWTSDDTNHWHECNNCDEDLDKAAHTFDKEVATDDYIATPADCDNAATYYKSCECGAKGTDTFTSGEADGHSPKTEWSNDETNHWHDCNNCDEDLDKAAHTFDKEVATDDYIASTATSAAAATYYKSCECGAKGTETFSYGDPLKVPPTGDTSNVMVWVVTLILSAGAVSALAIYKRKRTTR